MKKDENLQNGSEFSRRQFLKHLGAATGTLALIFSPLGSFISLGQESLFSSRKSSVSDIDFRESDPENPDEGDIWLRIDEIGEE